jgi:hypothetical protein
MNVDTPGGHCSTLHIESAFSSLSSSLLTELENHCSSTQEAGITGLRYAFVPSYFSFLTAPADRILPESLVHQILEEIRLWGIRVLAMDKVSSPQLRVYLAGCSREIFRDEIDARWHYLLCFSNPQATMSGRLRLVTNGSPASREGVHIAPGMIDSSELLFNKLVAHPCTLPYGIAVEGRSSDPRNGVLLLDGYIW